MSSLKPTIAALGVAMPLLAVAAVMLRFKARQMKRMHLGADDFTIVPALVRFSKFLVGKAYVLSSLTER